MYFYFYPKQPWVYGSITFCFLSKLGLLLKISSFFSKITKCDLSNIVSLRWVKTYCHIDIYQDFTAVMICN